MANSQKNAKQAQEDEQSLEELKDEVIDKYGLDEDEQSELIDKLVEDQKEARKSLSTAIRQKRKWRDKAQKGTQSDKDEDSFKDAQSNASADKGKALSADAITNIVDKKLEERELDSLPLDDKLKKEIRTYAKVQKIDIQQALDSDYIQYQIDKAEKEQRIDSASISPLKRSSQTRSNTDVADVDALLAQRKKIDFSTKEGRKKWKKLRKKFAANQQ